MPFRPGQRDYLRARGYTSAELDAVEAFGDRFNVLTAIDHQQYPDTIGWGTVVCCEGCPYNGRQRIIAGSADPLVDAMARYRYLVMGSAESGDPPWFLTLGGAIVELGELFTQRPS